MTPGLVLYRLATLGLAPFVPLILAHRARSGKESPERLNERLARQLPERPPGPLVWMHGASVGEAQILLGLAGKLAARDQNLSYLLTCQTMTAAHLIGGRLPTGGLQQMAPVDTPAAARRFLSHWQPDLAVLAEGEIWPNLLVGAASHGTPLALVNARMTHKSTSSWGRWPATARRLFGSFDLILPADADTASSLEALAGKPVNAASNLKRGLPPPPVDVQAVEHMRGQFLAGRKCILAASTHPGEEEMFLQAARAAAPDAALVIALRHPERAAEVAELLSRQGLSFVRRSLNERPTENTQVLLADTIGEMGLWYRMADAVFLGGASVEGIGGHNPIEPLQLGKRLVTGPYGFNFDDLFSELNARGLVEIAASTDALSQGLREHLSPMDASMSDALGSFLSDAETPLEQAAGALVALMNNQAHP